MVTAVKSGPIDRAWTTVGSLMANESLAIRPEVTGRVVRIGFAEGGPIARDALLFELDASVDRAQVNQAAANLALASRNAQRVAELFADQLISPAERDAATASLDAATATLELARARLAKTVIQAPFAGRAGLRKVAVGDYVNPGQDLVMLEDIARMKLEFRLPELALSDVRTGQAVEFELDAFPGDRFVATVYALDSGVSPDTRSFALRAVLDNPDQRLRPGQFARVRLIVETTAAALLIPEQAIVPRGEQAFVFVIENGKAVERAIRLGQRRPGEVQVLEGLTPGDSVVVSGLQKITHGSAVEIVSAGAPSANASP
ncbi:MAG: efflux RND transporter periplasmic adaptor subunit [Panacagrimonas sp.]